MKIEENEAYIDGRKTGRNWPIKWTHLPGGPHYNYNCGTGKENNTFWKNGFKRGLKENRNKGKEAIRDLIIKAEEQF